MRPNQILGVRVQPEVTSNVNIPKKYEFVQRRDSWIYGVRYDYNDWTSELAEIRSILGGNASTTTSAC